MLQLNNLLISIILVLAILILAWIFMGLVLRKLSSHCLNLVTSKDDDCSETAIINMDDPHMDYSLEIVQPEMEEPSDKTLYTDDYENKPKIQRRLFESLMSNQFDSADEMSFIHEGYSETETTQQRKTKAITTRFAKYLDNVPGIEPMILISLYYNAVKENLIMAIIKVANLKPLFNNRKPDVYVRVEAWIGNVIKLKKKTVVQKQELNPVYNQKMEFHASTEDLESVKIIVSVGHADQETRARPRPLHEAVFGGQFNETFLEHWKAAISSNKPIAKWHVL